MGGKPEKLNLVEQDIEDVPVVSSNLISSKAPIRLRTLVMDTCIGRLLRSTGLNNVELADPKGLRGQEDR